MTEKVETPAAEAPESKPEEKKVEVEAKPTETPAEKPVETPEAKPEEKKEQTIGDVLDGEGGEDKGKPKSENAIPEAAFLEEKKGRKEAEKRAEKAEADLKALKESIEGGATKSEISEDVEALAEKHGVDKDFLKEFAATIEKRVRKEGEAAADKAAETGKEKDRQEKIDKAFSEHFDKAMADMPEFKDIVNKDVIKTLSLDPKNAKKTFKQLIEDTYGNAIPGKRTVETTKPGGGKDPGVVDMARAKKDSAYFKEVMADPELKKQYNEKLPSTLQL